MTTERDGCRRPTIAIRGSSAVAFALVLAVSSAAVAQPEGPADPAAPSLSAEDEQARALYVEGDRRYAEGRYDEAVDLFRQAYALSPQPLLLYNMVNSLERMGDYAEAARVLRQYIDSGDVADADTLRQRLMQIERRAATRADEISELAALRGRPESCPAAAPCGTQPDEPRRSVLPYVFLGTGGAALVSALVFGTLARNEHGNAADNCLDGLCTSAARRALDRERRFALITDVSVAAGALSLGAGVYLYLRDRKRAQRREETALIPAVSAHGVGVWLVGGF